MTAHKKFKNIVRERQNKTGESYTAARAHVMRERTALLESAAEPSASSALSHAQGVVLKVNAQSARVRIFGEHGEVTFRSRDVSRVVPGHVVTLVLEKRWKWRADAYASGRI